MANYIFSNGSGNNGVKRLLFNDEKGKTVAIDYEEYEQFSRNSGWWEAEWKDRVGSYIKNIPECN